MTKPTFTPAELKEFKGLVDLTGSIRQMDRITARTRMPAFMEQHGKEKCDAMFDELCRKYPKEGYQRTGP